MSSHKIFQFLSVINLPTLTRKALKVRLMFLVAKRTLSNKKFASSYYLTPVL